jgi:hypothetical protein
MRFICFRSIWMLRRIVMSRQMTTMRRGRRTSIDRGISSVVSRNLFAWQNIFSAWKTKEQSKNPLIPNHQAPWLDCRLHCHWQMIQAKPTKSLSLEKKKQGSRRGAHI